MDNFYIKLHKGAKTPFFKTKDNDFFRGETLKNGVVADFVKGYDKFDLELIKSLWFRQLLHARSLCRNFPERVITAANFEAIDTISREKAALFEEQGVTDFRVNWRLAIGLGNASVFDNSLTLHHVYGVPYIPASTVKGIIRSWLIQEYFSYNKDGEKYDEYGEGRALRDSESFCLVFGSPSEFEIKEKTTISSRIKDREGKPSGHMGNVVFFDALPITKPKVYVDIMNPHYQEYYKEDSNQPPADWQNPVPIFFLTIKDTDFQFLFGLRKTCSEEDCKKMSNVTFEHPSDPKMNKKGAVEKVLKQLLEEALNYSGLGAKTAVGYGRMKNITKENLLAIKQQKEKENAAEEKRKAALEEEKMRAKKTAMAAERLAASQEKKRIEKEQMRIAYQKEGLHSKLDNLDDFEKGKEIISEFKNVVGKFSEAEYVEIRVFIERCLQEANSKKARRRWKKKGKGNWGLIESWTSSEVANAWFEDLI